MFNVPAGLGTFLGVISHVPNKREHLFPIVMCFHLIPSSASCSLSRSPNTSATTSLPGELSSASFYPQQSQNIAQFTFTAAMAYTSLDLTQKQIRLLHLTPAASHDARLECSFSLVSFDEEVDYEALSYTWGDVTSIMPINLEGKEVLITKNLHSALSHLRYSDRERILWADALCINQADLLERAHQVSLMTSIYSRAALVVASLGDAWEGCKLAIDVFEQLGRDRSLHLVRSLNPSVSVHCMGLESAELRDRFIQFFASPWWNRLCK